MGYILSVCVLTSSAIAMWLYDEPTTGIWLAIVSVWFMIAAGIHEIMTNMLKNLAAIMNGVIAVLKRLDK